MGLLLIVTASLHAQSYTAYFTGNSTDITTTPAGGICLMGGATENDSAMKWFLDRANGGDVLVLRASGSDGYNNYMFSQLGATVNSVETIVCNSAAASQQPYLHQKIQQAEAIWFAGGDQWNYVSYWRNTPVDSLINDALQNRNIVIGGTSAGMAILGGFYFSAENGTVTSSAALANPYDNDVTPDVTPFLEVNYLHDVITDTHYDDPDRKGRHVTFLARILTDHGVEAKGIACDEYTAVCIDESGIASVYGDWPSYDDNAYFLIPNCELLDRTPETCTAGTPLNWNRGQEALNVYTVKGTLNGLNTFDLNDWQTGSGGLLTHWYVDNGTLREDITQATICPTTSRGETTPAIEVIVYPDPYSTETVIETTQGRLSEIILMDLQGRIMVHQSGLNASTTQLDLHPFHSGVYLLQVSTQSGHHAQIKLTR